MDKAKLQALYLQGDYYWGTAPNTLAKSVVAMVPSAKRRGKRVADLGAGEGRDSVFLAKHGFDVLAVDYVPAGLDKARRLAEAAAVSIETLEGDLNVVGLPPDLDIVYSNGALEYVRPELRPDRFQHFKDQTVPGGLHFMFAFSEHPEVAAAPDWGDNEYLYRRGELPTFYTDWEMVETYERVFNCDSSSIPHRHAATVVIARKPR